MTEKRNNDLNVPTLRFPGFDGEWTTVRLGDLVNIQSGFAFKSEGFTDNGIKLVIPKNFTKHGFGNFDHSISKFSNELPPPNYKCRAGDLLILLTDLTPSCELLGKPLLIKEEDGEVWLNQRIIRLDTNSTLSKRWLLYFLQTNGYHKVIKETASGSTVRHSSNKIINDMILSLPTIEEQEKISSVLQSIDDRILTQNKIIEELKLLKSTLCDKIYSGFEENYEFETSIGDLIDYIQPNRFIVSINEYSNDNTLIPVLTANKSFILGYTEDTEGICSIGECVIFDDFTMDMKFVNFPFKVKSSAIKILKPKPGSNIRFLYDYLKFLKLNSGEHKRHYISEIEPKTLKLPNIILQNKVSNLMRSHDSKILIEENILSYLMMLKEYLLKKIFI